MISIETGWARNEWDLIQQWRERRARLQNGAITRLAKHSQDVVERTPRLTCTFLLPPG